MSIDIFNCMFAIYRDGYLQCDAKDYGWPCRPNKTCEADKTDDCDDYDNCEDLD